MPQMSPLNWTFLFIYFLALMLMMMFKIYFFNYPMAQMTQKKMLMSKTIKWQW
uniref:ATP synthase F0 subunit 8 n=1 Tax=Tomocerus caputiviolaceus TaxID=2763923 RepID=UPI0021D51C72|nr:ATP synthase F0 subunit 8 [Tomocerus caputiviolaceus]UXC95408.1 ATP synthase F0 subunit 8 [Tomocerus caputiviolaceus]